MHWLRELVDRHWLPLPPVARRVLIGALCVIAMLTAVLITQSRPQNSVSTSDWLTSAPTPIPSDSGALSLSASVMVQVVGAVREPGVFTLNLGARVIDAVFAAGGFAPDADQGSINLARPLSDGEQILVLTREASQASGALGGAGVGASTQTVNINRADLAALDSLPGIGPTLAQRILDYRQANGGFRSLSDLGKVAGIGPALLAKLKPAISL